MGYMQECLNDLNHFEKKILGIALSDGAKYDEFKRKIAQMKQELLDKGDDSNFAVDYANKVKYITMIQNLSMEIDSYMEGKDQTGEIELKLEWDTPEEYGKGKIKKHRIGVYETIIEVIEKAEKIDIEKLMKVAKRWEEEKKSELQYSPIEINVVEEMLADALMEYQLGYIQKNRKLPEENVAEFCSLSCYEQSLREKLLQALQTMDKGAFERLELENLLMTGTLKEMLVNGQMWKAISGVEIDENARIEIGELKKKEEPNSKEENEEIVAVPQQRKQVLIRVRKKNFFGKEVEKKISIKLEGNKLQRSQIPEKYRNNIVYIDIPEGIEYLESEFFSNEKNLEFVNFPASLELTEINQELFQGCKKLKRINIPPKCKKIGLGAFQGAEALEEVNMSQANSLEEIYYGAFANCKALKRIVIPKKCRYIWAHAFSGAETLEEVDMSQADALETITMLAFTECKNLKRLKLPRNCKEIEEEEFKLFKGGEALEEIDMSEASGLEIIGNFVFENYRYLKRVKFPRGCRIIGDGAFSGAEALEEVDMSEVINLEKIGRSAFEKCKSLKKITIPEKCKYIGAKAFSGAEALEEVDMSKARELKKIGNYAFQYCKSLKILKIPGQCEMGHAVFLKSGLRPEDIAKAYEKCEGIKNIGDFETIKKTTTKDADARRSKEEGPELD